jgi:hypothetical protein
MDRLCPQQNGLRILYTIGSSDCIGVADPPVRVFRMDLYKMESSMIGKMAMECASRGRNFALGASW